MKKRKTFLTKIVNCILGFVIVVLALFIISSKLPILGGYKSFAIMSGSMEPKIKTGALVFENHPKKYQVNDVITYRDFSNRLITHRLVAIFFDKGKAYFVARGDANTISDFQILSKNDIVGKVFFQVNHLGYIVSFSQSIPGLIVFIIIPATIILYQEIINLKTDFSMWKIKKRKKIA